MGYASYGENSWVKIEQDRSGYNSIDDNKNYTVITLAENEVILPAGTEVNGEVLATARVYPVNSTLVRFPDGSYDYYDSTTNGVVYVHGDIDDLWGVNKGRRTITAEGDRSTRERNQIVIGGKEDDDTGEFSIAAWEKGLIQFGLEDADNNGVLDIPKDAANVLGLVARDVYVSDKLKHNNSWANSHPASRPLYLYALVLGGINGDGGTYAVQGYNRGGAGWCYRYGSRIVVEAGAWGTTTGNGFRNGNTFFDPKGAEFPPPYFPAAPTFLVKSYTDLPILKRETL